LSQYEHYNILLRKDKYVIDCIQSMNPKKLLDLVEEKSIRTIA